MRLSVSDRGPEQLSADALVVLFYPERGRSLLPMQQHLRPSAARLLNRAAEAWTWLETRELPTPRVLFYGLPSPPDWPDDEEPLGGHAGSYNRESWTLQHRRTLRNAGAAIERACTNAGIRHAVLAAWPDDCEIELVAEGMALRGHDPRAWERSNDGPVASTVRRVSVCLPPFGRELSSKQRRAVTTRLRETMKVIECTNFARELGDLPGNIGTPSAIVERVRAEIAARELEIELSTITAAQAAKLGMGLFLAVDAGAPKRGCILRLDYDGTGDPDAPLYALVGKGLTHDTGGYNIKVGRMIHELTYDKCGATAVIGAMLAIAALELPLRIVGLCPLTENCVDARAFKPGDVLTACNGTTVYVENTDAEGRLVIADVLAWLCEHEPAPELVIDLATLTGALHAALGEPYAGLYCNEDRARELLMAAGKQCGDLLWPMPIHEIHDRDLGHHKADLRNVGALAGAPSSAAAFLREFVDYPWAHIDLAGKSHWEFARECYGPGATGFGTRLLVELARQLASGDDDESSED
ncbi:MAG TPA: leucyl aminopeptidase family protein [Enhygromyxa sp.]|nr:leucyl aminopeptidase family protein [Enhygromyxa sp.]